MSHLWTDPRLMTCLGWSLLHFLWQGAALALLLGIMLPIARSAKARYLIACSALLLCLVVPAGTALHGWRESRVYPLTTSQVAAQPLGSSDWSVSPDSWKYRLDADLHRHMPLIVFVWGLGCGFMGLRFLTGWAWTLRWRRQSHPAPEAWQSRLRNLGKRLGTGNASWQNIGACLRSCGLVDSPLTVGFWKPIILVPTALFTGIAPEYLEALLAHELAHVRRYDPLVNLLQNIVEALLFYHPAVWWISRQIRIEREYLADEQAAAIIGEPRRLAIALNTLDDLQPHLSAMALAARGGHLSNRIHRLLGSPSCPRTRFALSQWALPLLLVAALLCPMAAAMAKETNQETPIIFVPSHLVEKIDALARQESIDPALLRAIAWCESHFNDGAVSRIGARGILQVTPETARQFGAQNLDDQDQVAAAGARYLRHLLDLFQGNWSLAVAAYNGGEYAVESGQLSDETRAYVPQVLALAETQAVQPDSKNPDPRECPVKSGPRPDQR